MPEKIRVMQITHDLNLGGLQRIVSDLALHLDKDRFDVSVCVLREGAALEEELLSQGIRVIRLPSAAHKADYLLFWKLYQLLKKEKLHVIHTHNTQPLTDGVPAAILAGVPVRIHTDHARQFPDKKRYMFAEWVLSHFVDRIVAVSENTKANLIRYEHIRPDKIQIVQNGIDGDKYQQQVDSVKKKAALGIANQSAPFFGFCGRLSPEKGLSFLLRAFSLLLRDLPSATLLIIGGGGELASLQNEAENLKINQQLVFLGPCLHVHEILGLLDIFVLPSLREGLPLVLLEAMAASLPLIATDVGGNPQAVRVGENGLLVPPGDVDALYSAMKKLAIDKTQRRQFGIRSREIFIKNFSIKKMIKAYEAIYLHCLHLRDMP